MPAKIMRAAGKPFSSHRFFSFHFVDPFRALLTHAEAAENKSVSFERHCQDTPLSTNRSTRSIFDEITLAVTAA
jgi:hypothetical protein